MGAFFYIFQVCEEWAARRGFRVARGSVRVLEEVRAEIARRSASGELDTSFHARNLTFFRYEQSSDEIAEVRAAIYCRCGPPSRASAGIRTGRRKHRGDPAAHFRRGVAFDRGETEAILAGRCRESAAAKLRTLGLTEEALIGRNLAQLVARRRLSSY